MAATFTPLERIETSGGEVMKALRSDEADYRGLGEAYFSRVDARSIRAWKLHTEMTVNVVVPVGHVRFAIQVGDPRDQDFHVYDLGPDHEYGRLTIEPNTWFGFGGGADGGLVLNLADILHHPDEGRSASPDHFGTHMFEEI
ncbi:MAG: dTDP-4-dehydrorhamnose 3,5-epimerase [Acidimicrobiales bacterium]